MGFVFYWSIMVLVRSAEVTGKKTIQSLLHYCFGYTGEITINIALVFIAWGAMAAYVIILGDVLPKVLGFLMGEPSTEFMKLFLSRRGQVILSSFFVLFPVSMARSLAGLAKFSGIGKTTAHENRTCAESRSG